MSTNMSTNEMDAREFFSRIRTGKVEDDEDEQDDTVFKHSGYPHSYTSNN